MADRRRLGFGMLAGGCGAPPAVVGAGVGAVQECVHAVQALKLDTMQCSAQAWVLHALCSFKYGHSYPPKVAAVVMLRDLDCDPVPQLLVHVVQALNAETTQCWAQA